MTEHDWRVARRAVGVIEPRHRPGRRGGCTLLELQVHAARGIDDAQPREGVDDEAQAIVAAQRFVPEFGLIAVHALQKVAVVVPQKSLPDLLGALQGLPTRPLRRYAGVYEKMTIFLVRQWQSAQPVDQRVPFGRIEDLLQRVGVVQWPDAGIDGEQVQIVVAEQGHGHAGLDAPLDRAQRGERLRAAVDEVAHEDQPARVRKPRKQRFEAGQAALQVTDGVGAHGCHRNGCVEAVC